MYNKEYLPTDGWRELANMLIRRLKHMQGLINILVVEDDRDLNKLVQTD